MIQNAIDPQPRKRSSRIAPWFQAAGLFLLLALLHAGRPLWTGDIPAAENFQNMPLCKYSWDCLRHGILPLWNPYAFAGIPHFETHHAAALYPPVYVLFGLFNPFTAFNLMMLVHYFWMGLGCWALLRFGWRLRHGAALAGGVFFMLAGYNIAHEGHASLIWAAAWIPWLLWFSRRTLAGRPLAAPMLALLIFMQVAAGFIQLSIYNWIFMGAEALVLSLRPPWASAFRRLGVWAMAVACGLGLLSVQFFSTAGILGMTNRVAMPYNIFALAGFPLSQVPMLFFPLLMGAEQNYLLVHKYSFGLYPQSELVCSMGAAVWVGVLLLLGRGGDAPGTPRLLRPALRRQAWFWSGVIVFCLVAALGEISPVNKVLFHVPVVRIFRVQTRMMVFANLGIAILAALGLDRLLGVLWHGRLARDSNHGRDAHATRPRLGGTILTGLLLLAAAIPAAWLWVAFFHGRDDLKLDWAWFFSQWFRLSNPALWLPVAFGAAALGVLAFLWRRPRAWKGALFLWIGLYALEQGILTAHVVLRLTMPASSLTPPGNDAAAWMLDQNHGRADDFRVLSPTAENIQLDGETMPFMLPQFNGIYSAGGYFPFEKPIYFQLLKISNIGSTEDAYGLLARPALLAMLNIRYLIVGHWFNGVAPVDYKDLPDPKPVPKLLADLEAPGRYPWLRPAHVTPHGVTILENTRALPRAWTVDHVIPSRTAEDSAARLWDDRAFNPAREATVVWTDGRLPNASASAGLTTGTARVTLRTFDRLWLEVSAPRGPTFLVLSEAWYPGWWARLDGNLVPIHITDALLRGIEIPQGTHTLKLRYLPTGFTRGLKISMVFSLIWSAWVLRALFFNHKKHQTNKNFFQA